MEDPFAVLDDAPTETEPAISPMQDDNAVVVPSGGVFVFDLETIPDESRFPRPVKVEKVKRPDAAVDLAKLVTQTVPNIKAKISTLSEAQLNQLGELERATPKPRSGVLDAINDQLAIDNADDHEAAMNEWKKLSFDPFGCRIVALGIKSHKHRITMLAKNDDEERELLRVLCCTSSDSARDAAITSRDSMTPF